MQLSEYTRRARGVFGALRERVRRRDTAQRIRTCHLAAVLAVAGVLAAAGGIAYLNTPPASFPLYERIEIPEGYTLAAATELLAAKHAVRSRLLLHIAVVSRAPEAGVKAGIYYFETPLSALEVAGAITSGTYGAPAVRLTVPEGLRIDQIAEIVARTSNITEEAFVEAAAGYEGYLFPDTYHVPESFTAPELVTLMYETFEERIEPYEAAIAASDRSLDEIVTMASLIEREANSTTSMQLVSGILWRRVAIDMLLQVDAAFEYVLDKSSTYLTREDMQIDSPYNTYRYRGLPPTPIANPGIDAIDAAVNPRYTPYLYYLTAPDGTFYYAQTYEEHVANIDRYLR